MQHVARMHGHFISEPNMDVYFVKFNFARQIS